MKNNLLLTSALLSAVFLYTGCIKRESPVQTQYEPAYQNEVYTQSQPTQTIYTNPPENIVTSPAEDISNSTTINYPESSSNALQLQTIHGDAISIGERSNGFTFPQYQGKIILLQIFGKECEFCFEEMPIINKMRSQFGSQLQVIAIQGQERMSPSESSALINRFNMNYPIIEKEEARDILVSIGSTYNWTGSLPLLLLIKDGVTEYTFSDGGVSYNELRESIQSLL